MSTNTFRQHEVGTQRVTDVANLVDAARNYLVAAGHESASAESASQRIAALAIDSFHRRSQDATTDQLCRRAIAIAIGEASSRNGSECRVVPSETHRPMGPAMPIRTARWLRLGR
ncbi:hypothetical protein Pla22_51600 [Rubripirellula amarantea]|uniref:Uncharacterized protein n=1 Tax=Rubripirellula amarantea TaxID=2527999 RepID=A0A5C5WDN6_9BACT|nr:hypothetical protein [Rubripirellula amarantea]TWT48159.1 hypothetical protein Pla22_51600 [Rubripirellula amarantea]